MKTLQNLTLMLTLPSFNAFAHPGHDDLVMAGQEGLLWVVMGVVCMSGLVALTRLHMHRNSAKGDG